MHESLGFVDFGGRIGTWMASSLFAVDVPPKTRPVGMESANHARLVGCPRNTNPVSHGFQDVPSAASVLSVPFHPPTAAG